MAESKMPAKIRVAQDADGFWTCREAVSGSPEFIRADLVEQMAAALRIIAGREQCIDNLMSKADVANAAIQAYEAAQSGQAQTEARG